MFVVGSSEPWSPAARAALDVDEAFAICTVDSVGSVARDRHLELTLYRGATYEDPFDGMYSFLPAKLADDADSRFARPSIRSRFIKPSNKQSTMGSKESLSTGALEQAWKAVRDQVLAHGLLLAVHIQTPERLASDTVVPTSDRERC
jgi:hypothetical protein